LANEPDAARVTRLVKGQIKLRRERIGRGHAVLQCNWCRGGHSKSPL
jgi:hypothetical protein